MGFAKVTGADAASDTTLSTLHSWPPSRLTLPRKIIWIQPCVTFARFLLPGFDLNLPLVACYWCHAPSIMSRGLSHARGTSCDVVHYSYCPKWSARTMLFLALIISLIWCMCFASVNQTILITCLFRPLGRETTARNSVVLLSVHEWIAHKKLQD